MSTHSINMAVNGETYSRTVEGSETLLEFLRDDLRLTGTKNGCAEGDCGACTVIMNGSAVKSCMVLAVQADSATIETVEGLQAPTGKLHPLQQAFVETGAVQCGYCTPGMLMASKALLDNNPSPDEREIRSALSGNLCRCTGYAKIVDAVSLAASRLEEQG